MRLSEWPLVFFTVMIQMSIGFVIAFSVLYNLVLEKNVNIIPREVTSRLLFFIWPLVITALLISFFHLGSPRNAIFVLSNISTSWLSREILLTIIFSFFTFGVSILLYREIFSPQVRYFLLVICAVIGVMLIFTMSKLYMLQTVPAWNSNYTPASFFLTALVLGIFSFLIVLTYFFQQHGKNIFLIPETEQALRILLGLCLVLIIAEIAIWFLHLKVLSEGIAASKTSFDNIIHGHAVFSIIRILLNAAAMILLSYMLFMTGNSVMGTRLVYVTYFVIILLELTGRFLFYAMYARIGV